jgi:hypothetical protein
MKYLLPLILLSGCSLLPVTAKDKIASGVMKYCAAMTETERAILRADVNSVIYPNEIRVTCDGDE